MSDPVPGGAALAGERLVLCEGNYLLLGSLADCADCAVRAEARRWAPLLQGAFDETWFVAPAGGVDEQRARLVDRHLETWTAEKTAAWDAATPREGAERRTDANDVPNARLIDRCRPFADRLVVSL